MRGITATVALACVLGLGPPLFAEEAREPSEGSEAHELAELLAIVAQETAVATKSRMNSDFVPGIVTVLHGDELEALGIETAWEALSMVPGIQVVRERTGLYSVIVRGLPFPFNSGNVRVLIDGVSVGRESAGVNGVSLQIPIQMVERIEVIRGPGSAVYGDFAFMGLVSIVTRKDGARVYARGGGDESLSGGATVTAANPSTGITFTMTAAGFTTNDAAVAEPRRAEEDRGFGRVALGYKGLSLNFEAVSRDVQATRTAPGEPATGDQRHWALDSRWAADLSRTLSAEVHGTYLSNRFNTGPSDFSGAVGDFGADLKWKGWKNQSWLLSASYARAETELGRQMRPPRPGVPGPPSSTVIEDQVQTIAGVTLQDTIDLSGHVAVTAGARFDHNSDIGSHVAPRCAVVWRVAEGHILKAQYAEGFRAPTFFELYGQGVKNNDLEFELNRTAELHYVFRLPDMAARATFFYSKILQMIFVGPGNRFDNDHDARAFGVEGEFETRIGSRLKAQMSLSWVDSKTNRNATHEWKTPPSKADWLGSFALTYRAAAKTLLALRLNHAGERNASEGQNGGYSLLDLTVTQQDLFLPGLQFRAGVKNVFNQRPRYLLEAPNSTETITYPGRTAFAQLAWAP